MILNGYLFLEFGFMAHDLRGDFTVAENDDDQREDPAPNPQDEDEQFRFQSVRHVVESAAGQVTLYIFK